MTQVLIYNIAKEEDGVSEWRDGVNPRIVQYHSCTSLKAQDDSVPWCSSFVNWCCDQAGVEGTNSAAAKSWLNWGEPVDKPNIGDLAILQRGSSKSQGHVGFFEDIDNHKKVLKIFAGNQGDEVCSAWFPLSQVLGYRTLKTEKEKI